MCPFRGFTIICVCACMMIAIAVPEAMGSDDPGQILRRRATVPSTQDTDQEPDTEAGNDANAEPDSAQPEQAPAAEEETPQQQMARLKQEWQDLQAEIDFAAERFRAERDPKQQSDLKKVYLEMLGQADGLIAQLKHAAEKVFADGGDDQAARTLMGIMMNDAEAGKDAETLRLGDVLIQGNVNPDYFAIAAQAKRLSIDAREVFEELQLRQAEAKADDLPRVTLVTDQGEIILELFENQAPHTVANFINLVEKGFYDGLKFHRVIEGFMAQGGCPKGDGTGGPGYDIPCECYTPEARRHFTGSLSMANAGKDTGGSQFFLTFRRTKALDGRHTVFGRIISGMDVLDKLARTYDSLTNQPLANVTPSVIQSAKVLRKRDHEYVPKKMEKASGAEPEPESDSPPTQPESGGEPATPDADSGSEGKEPSEGPSEGDSGSDGESVSIDLVAGAPTA